MTARDSRVTVHMASSLDGFISRKDEDISWFETADAYEHGVEQENVEEFLKTIGCYVMGARTYELALRIGWVYGDTPAIVLTHRDLPKIRDSIEFHAGDLAPLAGDLRRRYGNVWVAGGANVVTEFVRQGLADDIRMSVLPVILGDGIPFFDRLDQQRSLHLRDAKAYKNGILSLWYEIRK